MRKRLAISLATCAPRQTHQRPPLRAGCRRGRRRTQLRPRKLLVIAVLFLVSAQACSTAVVTAPPSVPVEAPPRAAPEPAPAAPPTSVLDGIFTEAQAARGRAAYDAHCAECHGEELRGDEMAPGLTGVAFRFRWRGLKVADIYDSVQSTMPPEEPATLGDQPYIDIVAFLLSANGFPTGDRELAADSKLLEGVAVERMPP